MFRGKESSNRIEISQLVQDLLNFGVLGSLQLWGGWGCMVVGGCPTHMCTCMHMSAHTHMHIYTLNMIISFANGCPHWGNPWEFPMMSYMCTHIHACMCMHVHVYMGYPPKTPPPPSTHPTPSWGPPESVKIQ